MVRSNPGDWRMIFGTDLSVLKISLMMYGRTKWQEATIKDFNTVLTGQDKKFFTFELFKVIQDAIPLDPSLQDNVFDSEQFLRVHSSYWMCSQFTLHHKFRIDSGGTKFYQGHTDGILYSCETLAQETPKSKRAWSDQTTSCILQAKSGKCTKIRCTGSIYSLLNGKDWSSIKQDRTQSSSTIRSQLVVSRK